MRKKYTEMASISELKELFKQIEINNCSRESDKDFIKYAFEKATARDEVLPLITDDLETKNEKTAAIKLQMAIKMSKDQKAPLEKIISFFNQSVAYAKHKSKVLTQAYINRHTFLMNMSMYEEASKELEYAMSTGVTDILHLELSVKKIKNLLALDKRDLANVLLRDTENSLSKLKMEETRKIKIEMEVVKLSIEIGNYLKYSNSYTEKFANLRPNSFRPAVVQRDNCQFISTEKYAEKRSFNTSEIILSYLPDLGYHLVAKEDIRPSKLLLIDQIYEKVINCNERYLRCWNCTKFCWTCIPCHKCANVIFCSTQCRNSAFKNHHNIECQIISVLLNHRDFYNEKSFLSLRVLIRALKELNDLESLQRAVERIKTECKNVELMTSGIQINEGTKYRHFYCMVRDPMDKKSKDKHSFASVYYTYILAATTEIFGKKIKDIKELMNHPSAPFVAELLFHHAMIIDKHLFPLRQRILCENARIYGGAIIPTVSLCSNDNHPNSYQFFNFDKIILSSMANIKKGEIIRTHFGPNYLKMLTTKERDIFLKKFKIRKQNESLPNQDSASKYSPCLNHLESNFDYNSIRLYLHELSISNITRWSSNQLEKVPEKRILSILNHLFKFLCDHDVTEKPCISAEAVKLHLHYIFDFIDSYEL